MWNAELCPETNSSWTKACLGTSSSPRCLITCSQTSSMAHRQLWECFALKGVNTGDAGVVLVVTGCFCLLHGKPWCFEASAIFQIKHWVSLLASPACWNRTECPDRASGWREGGCATFVHTQGLALPLHWHGANCVLRWEPLIQLIALQKFKKVVVLLTRVLIVALSRFERVDCHCHKQVCFCPWTWCGSLACSSVPSMVCSKIVDQHNWIPHLVLRQRMMDDWIWSIGDECLLELLDWWWVPCWVDRHWCCHWMTFVINSLAHVHRFCHHVHAHSETFTSANAWKSKQDQDLMDIVFCTWREHLTVITVLHNLHDWSLKLNLSMKNLTTAMWWQLSLLFLLLQQHPAQPLNCVDKIVKNKNVSWCLWQESQQGNWISSNKDGAISSNRNNFAQLGVHKEFHGEQRDTLAWQESKNQNDLLLPSLLWRSKTCTSLVSLACCWLKQH